MEKVILSYEDFLKAKAKVSRQSGIEIQDSDLNNGCDPQGRPLLLPHQKVAIKWAIRGGRRALFESWGLGKTRQQLEILRIILKHEGGRALIVAPLGVRLEFQNEAEIMGIPLKFIRSISEAGPEGLYYTNYEPVRDGKLDPSHFIATSLDEADVLRGMGGVKTFREFMRLFEPVRFRFVATATPDPNEYIELLAYADYLGILQISEAKTRFFKRNSTKADQLTLHKDREEEFWLWVASWALFFQRPSDLGFDDTGYALPPMEVIYHEVKSDAFVPTTDRGGQMRMLPDASLGITDAAREKRASMDIRIAEMVRIVNESPADRFLLWHDLEDERREIEAAMPNVHTVYGTQDVEDKEKALTDFANGRIQYLAGKPDHIGSGGNYQRYCHKAIFVGIGFKFKSFIQAVHRIYRFLQTEQVTIHLIYSEAERAVLKILLKKWEQHKEKVERMSEIIKEYGLSELALAQALTRSIGVERVQAEGRDWTLIQNDSVLETRRMSENSVGLILTSIPFSTQYEYTPSYLDFGHTEGNDHFFEQMDYLTPELFRVLQPGRIAAIHVKDRIVPGGINKLGFQTAYPFHMETCRHFMRHGFAYLGMKTIVTDVVRENNQTYRLGWSEQCKDATKMGVGMPEYLLLFRKPPSDTANSYADLPVVKQKRRYSRSRWQIDAHGYTRSSGNRLLTPEEIRDLPHDVIFRMFREFSLATVYDFEHHVHLGEALEHDSVNRGACKCDPATCKHGRLPVTFMLFQPPSWHPDVWTDITRILTLNGSQHAKGRTMHLCPMQIDLADRVIDQLSMEGELVYDPFSGLGTVPYRAVLKGRRGAGVELNPGYFADACMYLKEAEQKMLTPTLFDAVASGEVEQDAAEGLQVP